MKALGLPLRQSYTFVLKRIYRDQRFRNHPKNRAKALKADRRLRTIAGRLVRELKRNLAGNHDYDALLSLFERVLSQKRCSRKKIYSLHEPEVQCISKGKEHKKYEFGNKVSIIRSMTGIILGAKSFRNEYDGHTIEESWVPGPSGTNMTGIPLKSHFCRWNALPGKRSGGWRETGATGERKKSTGRKY